MRTGDVIMLVEMVDADWIKGRLKDQEGIFPSGFVEIKKALPPKSKTTSAPPPSAGPGIDKVWYIQQCNCTDEKVVYMYLYMGVTVIVVCLSRQLYKYRHIGWFPRFGTGHRKEPFVLHMYMT